MMSPEVRDIFDDLIVAPAIEFGKPRKTQSRHRFVMLPSRSIVTPTFNAKRPSCIIGLRANRQLSILADVDHCPVSGGAHRSTDPIDPKVSARFFDLYQGSDRGTVRLAIIREYIARGCLLNSGMK
jgi:hypothetical protein